MELIALCGFAFLAGFVDAVVGGGGLIQVPALLVLMPQLPIATLLGTNKAVSIWGTLTATIQYARRLDLDWRATLPMALSALVFGYVGARTVSFLPPELLRPLVLGILVLVLLYTLWKKDFGKLHAPRLGRLGQWGLGLAAGALIGFYDGFFGPGTGSFLVLAFVGLFGFSFLHASASAKLINLITNGAALAYFANAGQVRVDLALPMAVCNVAGALLGARLALRHGAGFVRGLFLVVVSGLLLRFAWDISRG